MIEGPKWAVFSVEEVDELGHRSVIGASISSELSRAMYDIAAAKRTRSDVMMIQGAHVMIRSKPDWPLCGGKPR